MLGNYIYAYFVIKMTYVAPLNNEEFLLLEAIKKPSDRIEAFYNDKLERATKLKAGSSVDVKIGGANVTHLQHARTVVHYKGMLKEQNGFYFGVEILVSFYIELELSIDISFPVNDECVLFSCR